VPELVANLSEDFLFPKLHGLWSRSLTGAALERLVQSGREETLSRALGALGIDVSRRENVQKQIVAAHIAELAGVRRLADARTAHFYSAFVERHFFENLKTVLHYHYLPEHGVSMQFLLIEAPGLPRFDAEALLASRTTHQLHRNLPEHASRERLLPLLVELEDSHDILRAECRLDRMFYMALLAAAEGLPRSTRQAGCDLVRTEIDIVNLVMILRNAVLYRLSAEALRGLCLEGGRHLPARALEPLLEAKAVPAVVAALPRPYRALLEPWVSGELYLSENALWNHLYRLAYRLFTDYDHPAASVVAFPFLKRFEMLNIGRVFEGIHFGLGPADIHEMMIGAGHV